MAMPNSKRRCRYCREYKPRESMLIINGGAYCDSNHAFLYGSEKSIQAAEKATRAKTKKIKQSLLTKSDYVKKAQAAVNLFVRICEADKPCISCGGHPREVIGGGSDCGHYRSRGSAPHLRFYRFNMAKQCKKCNRYLSGNVVEFRKGLIARYGVGMVERIESDQRPRHYSIDDLKRIAKVFNRRARHYKRLRELESKQ